jgi:nitrate/TMAO reductase-like tetraheme cytochrome c subunit
VNPAHLEAVTQRVNVERGLKGVLTTRCPAGHPYDEVNTRWKRTKTGRSRTCRTCHRERERTARRASAGYAQS